MAVLGLGSDTFYLAKSVLRSSLVVHAVMGHISSPTAHDIVFGKSTALELLVLGEDGSLRSVWEQAVFGTIRDLKVLPWNKDVRHATPQVYGRDLLAVLSDSGHLSFVTFCTDAHRFLAISHVHLASPGFARRDLGWLLAVEQRGQAIAVAALKNRVAVFPVVRAANNSIIRKEDGIEYPQREYAWRGVPVKSLKSDVLGCVWSLSFVETHNKQEADHSAGRTSEDERGCLTLAAVVFRQGDAGSKVVIFTCGLTTNRPGFGLQLAAVVSLPGDEVSFSPLQLTGVPGMVGGVLVARSSDLVLVDASQPRSSKVVAVAALPGAPPGSHGGKGGGKNSKEETLVGCSSDFSRAHASKPRSSRMATAASQAGAAPGRRGGKVDGDSTKEDARRCKSHAVRGVASLDSPLETNNGPAECEGVMESWEEMVDSEDNDMGSARKVGASSVDAVLISAWSWEPLRQQDGEEWGNHHQHDESEHALEGGFDSCMEDQDALRPESTWPRLCICAGGLYMVEMAVNKGGRAGSCGDGRKDVVVEGEGCSDIEIIVKDCSYLVENGSSALLWAERDLIVVLEHMGDGHVLRVGGVSRGTGLLEEAVVQNLSPVLDFQLIDFYGERQDQMFACCGFGKEGSLRMIRNGWSVDRLMTTPAVYDGIVGMWSLKMNARDEYHSFLVMSFVKDTRVMKIGLSFEDNTEAVGFCPGEQTLACGRIEDGWLAQVCPNGVCICAPAADSLAIDSNERSPLPTVVTWSSPQSAGISMGAVGGGVVVVASSCPLGELIVLRVMVTAAGSRELIPTERRRIAAELSCISIPWEEIPASAVAPGGGPAVPTELYGPVRYDARQVCLVGTYEPTVEVLSLESGKNLPTVGVAPLVSNVPSGVGLGGFVPESIRLVQFDKLCVLVGLRNGMLLHYEWPSPVMPSVVVQPASQDVPSSTAYFPPAYFSRTEAGGQSRPDDGGSQSTNMCMSERGLASNVSLGTGEASELWCEASENASFGREGIRQSNESGGPVVLDGKGDDAVPSKPVVVLRLALMRRIGMSPVALVPLRPMVRSDVVALNDRPWLLQAARHSQRVSYTSIAFCPSTHAAPVSFAECPEGLIFAADRALHLVAVGQTKHMYAQKLMLGDTPWRLVYHPPSRLLLVICSCGKGNSRTQQFEIRGIDPASGSVLCSFQLKKGERALCMQLWTPSPETVLVAVGTVKESSLEIEPSNEKSRERLILLRLDPRRRSVGSSPLSLSALSRSLPASSIIPCPDPLDPRAPTPSSSSATPSLSSLTAGGTTAYVHGQEGEPMHVSEPSSPTGEENSLHASREAGYRSNEGMPSTDGVEIGSEDVSCGASDVGWEMIVHSEIMLSGPVLCVCPYLGKYLLASAGNKLFCVQFKDDWHQRPKWLAVTNTRFTIVSISTHLTHIAVGDCRDGISYFAFREESREFELLYSDPVQRLTASCVMIDTERVAVLDKKGHFSCLSSAHRAPESTHPEHNLDIGCLFYLGEVALQLRRGCLAYKTPAVDGEGQNIIRDRQIQGLPQIDPHAESLVAATLLGGVIVFLRLTREEYELLEALQHRLSLYPVTAPVLGNDLSRYRYPGSKPHTIGNVLDGEMLMQFLELNYSQQAQILKGRPDHPASHATHEDDRCVCNLMSEDLSGEQVLQLLERVHNSLV